MALCLTLARDDVKFELLSSAVVDVVMQVVLKYSICMAIMVHSYDNHWYISVESRLYIT